MGTINSAFSMISQALDADQSALNIVANNVANANTPGYTEETPNWQENQPIDDQRRLVSGDGVTRDRRHFSAGPGAGGAAGPAAALASASGSRLTALNTVQALFTPDSGSSTFDGRRYRQRPHRLLQFLLFA